MNEDKKLNDEALDQVTGGTVTPPYIPSVEEIRAWDDFYTANCGGCTKRTGGCPYNSDPRLIYLTFKGTSGCPFHS